MGSNPWPFHDSLVSNQLRHRYKLSIASLAYIWNVIRGSKLIFPKCGDTGGPGVPQYIIWCIAAFNRSPHPCKDHSHVISVPICEVKVSLFKYLVLQHCVLETGPPPLPGLDPTDRRVWTSALSPLPQRIGSWAYLRSREEPPSRFQGSRCSTFLAYICCRLEGHTPRSLSRSKWSTGARVASSWSILKILNTYKISPFA